MMNDDGTTMSTATVKTGGYELVIDRTFSAPPEKVFAAWTDPSLIVGWWGPDGMHTPELSLNTEVGGDWRTVMQSPEGRPHIAAGTYREIDPPKRLSFTWAWENDGVRGFESLVEIDFEAVSGGTLMHFRHSGFQTPEDVVSHNKGWTSSFGCLDRYVKDPGQG